MAVHTVGAAHRARILVVAATLGCAGGGDEPEDVATTPPAQLEEGTTAGPPTPALEGYSLHDAAAQGLVEYEVTGTGASSGDALLLMVRSTSAGPLTLHVAPGTVFGTSSPGVQSMVAWGVSGRVVGADYDQLESVGSIQLFDGEPQLYILEAYCLDFELDNPTPADIFRPAPVLDLRAATVIAAAKDSGLTMPATQAAIWMDRDHATKQEIAAVFDASDQELEDAWQLLKRMPPP